MTLHGISDKKEGSILRLLEKADVVGFWVNDGSDPDYEKGMRVEELCDNYFSANLDKQQAQQLVDELQELVNRMK